MIDGINDSKQKDGAAPAATTKVTPVKRSNTVPARNDDPIPDKMDSATWTREFVCNNEDDCSDGLLRCLDVAIMLLRKGDYTSSAELFSSVIHGLEMLSGIGPKEAELYKPPLYANCYSLSRIYAFRFHDRKLAKDAANKAYTYAKECLAMQRVSGRGSAAKDIDVLHRYLSLLSIDCPLPELEEEFGADFPFDISSDSDIPASSKQTSANHSIPYTYQTERELPLRKEPAQVSVTDKAMASEGKDSTTKSKKSPLRLILLCSLVVLVIVGTWHAIKANITKNNYPLKLPTTDITPKDADVSTPTGDAQLEEVAFKPMFEPGVACNTISTSSSYAIALCSDGTVLYEESIYESNHGQPNDRFDLSEWTDIRSVEAGNNHIVGLRADGTVVAAGTNTSLECSVKDWHDILAISANVAITVGLRSDGTVVAVGNNYYGRCNVSDWTGIIAVDAGSEHTVGLRVDGTVVATGLNDAGQCNTQDWTDIVAVYAGFKNTVGLKRDGTVVVIGSNKYGQCDVSSWTDIISVAIGMECTIGLRSDGTLVYAGSGRSVMGNDITIISNWTDIVAISNFDSGFFALFADGSVKFAGNLGIPRKVSSWKNIRMPSKVAFPTPPVIRDSPATDNISLDMNTDMGKYSGLLEKYYTAISRKDSREALMNANLNYLIAYKYNDTPLDNIGYCLHDFDGDGVSELLVAPIEERSDYGFSDKVIFDFYTLENDIPVLLYSSGERNTMLLLQDGSFYTEGSSGASNSGFFKCVFSGGQLVKTLSIDYFDGSWLISSSEGSEYVSAEYGQSVISELKSSAIKLDYTPFSAYPGLA